MAPGRELAAQRARAESGRAGPLIRLDSVVRRYGARVALAGISLDVREGETLGLVGANGAGKTTLIHLIAGLARPDSGSLRFADGSDVCSPEARRAIGVAFQDLAVYPELSVEENVSFFGSLYGLEKRDRSDAVEEALARVSLSGRRTSLARTLSGGMARRLNLACAIVHRPSLLLLDEPTAALDPKSRALLVEGLASIADAGTTVVISTHHLEEAERLCDRVAILDQGRLLALGSPAELSERHGAGLVEVELERPGDDERPRKLRLRWTGERPFDDARRLIDSGERVLKLRAEAASLETVFFALTGKRLDEE